LNLERAIARTIDVNVKFNYRLEIKEINKDICAKFKQINDILKGIGVDPDNLFKQYINIASICKDEGV